MQNAPFFMLFSGTSHPALSQEVANCLGVELGKVTIETFPDNEIGVHVLENVRGRDVFVLQSVARHPNLYLMELLILVDALKRASARSVNVIMPYFGYARQDRRGMGREPITAKLVADMLQRAGVARVLTMDLHTEQIQGFFDIPVDNLYARPAFLEPIKKLGMARGIVVTPDIGSIKLARSYASALQWDFAVVDKSRISAELVEVNVLIGDVRDRDVLLVDDMCSTGETLNQASWVCKRAGAKRIVAAVTHGLICGPGFLESAIEKMFVSNTISMPEIAGRDRLEVISVAQLFSQGIESIVLAGSISTRYQ